MTGQPSAPSPSSAKKPWALKVGVGLLVFALVWTAVLGWWLPGWARAKVETEATLALGTPVTLSTLSVQPWTLTVTLGGLKVGPPKAELLQLAEAQVQLSLESVWRLAPVVRRVTLTQPELWIERQTTQHFNFSDMVKRLQSQPSKPGEEPAHFAVYNIRVNQGLIRYTDRVLQQEHRVEALNIGVPFISNLPSFTSVDVQPLLEARVDGSALRVSGRTLPFTDGLRSTVDLNWSDVDVAQWALAARPFMPPDLALDVAQGRLDTTLTVSFEEHRPPALPKLLIHGGLKLSNVDVHWPTGGVQGRWSMLSVDGIDVGVLAHWAKVGSISLDGLQVDAKAVPPSPPVKTATATASTKTREAPTSKATPWTWSVGKVHVAASAINAQAPGGAPLPTLGPVTLNINGLDSHDKAAPAQLSLAATDSVGGQWGVTGVLSPTLPQATLKVSISKVQPAPWLAALKQVLPLPLQVLAGEVALNTDLQANAERLTLSQGQVQLVGLKTRALAKGLPDHVDLAGLDVQGLEATVSLATPQPGQPTKPLTLTLASVKLDKLDAQVTRGPQGQWAMLPPASTPKTDTTTASAAGDTAAPVVNVAEVLCKGCKVVVDDQTVTPTARLSLQQADLGLKGLSSDLTRVMGFDLNALGQGQGRIKLTGDVRAQPLLLHSQIAIAGLDLKVAQSYAAPYLNITLVGAKADVKGQLTLQAGSGKTDAPPISARYQGRIALTDLRTQDSVNQADFLRWRSLALDSLDLDWKDGALNADLGRIALNDFYGRLIINPNGQLNLADLVKHEAGAEDKSLTTPQAPAVSASAPASALSAAASSTVAMITPQPSAKPPMNLRWQGIKLSKGRVDFTDTFIKPNYSARLTQVEGEVSAVASSKPEPATVKISGAVDDSAPLLITGQLHPLGPRLYTDIQGTAKGIELTRLTPYAARYAGYAIEKGTLSVTVHYKVDNGKLEAENQIFLDQLTFGEKVDSPDATKLPVQFAVSLLKNSRGEIDVNLPISGSLDDPQFSVGGIVWHVLVNLISKAVTAPFSLLMGGGHDELGFVPFEPGDDELNDAARQRLDTLVTKLTDRPQVKLEATGRADAALDEAGLRQRHVMRLMRQAKAKATDQAPAAVTIAPEERDQWLTAAYKAADIKKPRNLVGLAKTLPPAEMEALLKASAPVDQASLLSLANRRGDRVKAYLASKLPPERVLLTASKMGAEGLPADDKGPATRVQFTLK
jgi:hypothetical protein